MKKTSEKNRSRSIGYENSILITRLIDMFFDNRRENYKIGVSLFSLLDVHACRKFFSPTNHYYLSSRTKEIRMEFVINFDSNYVSILFDKGKARKEKFQDSLKIASEQNVGFLMFNLTVADRENKRQALHKRNNI